MLFLYFNSLYYIKCLCFFVFFSKLKLMAYFKLDKGENEEKIKSVINTSRHLINTNIICETILLCLSIKIKNTNVRYL